MAKTFFRDCMPYMVEMQKGKIVVYNRNYHILYVGNIPAKLDKKKFFESIGFGEKKSLSDNQCYMYEDAICPVGNVKGYVVKDMEKYIERLKNLFKALGNEPTKAKESDAFDNEDLKQAWDIIYTMSDTARRNDVIIRQLVRMLGDEQVEEAKKVVSEIEEDLPHYNN